MKGVPGGYSSASQVSGRHFNSFGAGFPARCGAPSPGSASSLPCSSAFPSLPQHSMPRARRSSSFVVLFLSISAMQIARIAKCDRLAARKAPMEDPSIVNMTASLFQRLRGSPHKGFKPSGV